jgi:hypothetical protein
MLHDAVYSTTKVRCEYCRVATHYCWLTRFTVKEFPRGYPSQAAFQSEDSYSIYRSFSYLHSRVILQLQDELRALEDNLQDLDAEDDENDTGKRVLMSRVADQRRAKRDGKQVSDRTVLLGQIHDKLVKYDELLIKTRELKDFQKPPLIDYLSLRRWFYNEKPLSYEREEQFVRRKNDLVTLRPGPEWGTFHGWIEGHIYFKPQLRKVKASRYTRVRPFTD